jgi:pimeloyl-ACP methyl ester carboxylesterase
MVFVKVLFYFIFLYVMLCILMYFMQHRMIYYPQRRAPGSAELQALDLRFWPSDSQYRGFISTKEETGSAGTVVVFHGNAGGAQHRLHYMPFLEPLGYRVVLAEYPGYGGRSGRLNEKSFLEDAKKIVRLVHEQYGGPVFLCGESLGCGVATGVAADSSFPISGIILITPWDSLPELAQAIYRFFPARLLVRDKYDNIENLKTFTGRVAVALAGRDEVVPNRHAMRLYDALSCEKKFWIWLGAGHNSWPGMIDVSWWKEVMEFLSGDSQ